VSTTTLRWSSKLTCDPLTKSEAEAREGAGETMRRSCGERRTAGRAHTSMHGSQGSWWFARSAIGIILRPGLQRHAAPPPRTKWTRRFPHPVLIGHAASLSQVAWALAKLLWLLPSLSGSEALRRRARAAAKTLPPPRKQLKRAGGPRGAGLCSPRTPPCGPLCAHARESSTASAHATCERDAACPISTG